MLRSQFAVGDRVEVINPFASCAQPKVGPGPCLGTVVERYISPHHYDVRLDSDLGEKSWYYMVDNLRPVSNTFSYGDRVVIDNPTIGKDVLGTVIARYYDCGSTLYYVHHDQDHPGHVWSYKSDQLRPLTSDNVTINPIPKIRIPGFQPKEFRVPRPGEYFWSAVEQSVVYVPKDGTWKGPGLSRWILEKTKKVSVGLRPTPDTKPKQPQATKNLQEDPPKALLVAMKEQGFRFKFQDAKNSYRQVAFGDWYWDGNHILRSVRPGSCLVGRQRRWVLERRSDKRTFCQNSDGLTPENYQWFQYEKPPEGFAYTGKFRVPKSNEYFLMDTGHPHYTGSVGFGMWNSPRHILRKV